MVKKKALSCLNVESKEMLVLDKFETVGSSLETTRTCLNPLWLVT